MLTHDVQNKRILKRRMDVVAQKRTCRTNRDIYKKLTNSVSTYKAKPKHMKLKHKKLTNIENWRPRLPLISLKGRLAG